jgi:hypothetical protein
MELRQLRHFLALAEERSITRAAQRELIVQSGLSSSLQALERELGTPLYVRGTRPVRLTAAGEALAGPARRTLASAAQAEQAVHHTRDVLTGTLRIGVSLSAQHLVPFASSWDPGCPSGSTDPGYVEDADRLGLVIGMKRQQAIPGAERGNPVSRVASGGHYRRIPGLVHQDADTFHRCVERGRWHAV